MRLVSLWMVLGAVGCGGSAAEPINTGSTPQATFRVFLEATQQNNLAAAKRCWTVDDDNRSGVLDIMIGRWIASRRLVAVVETRLGANGLKLLGKWNRADLSDQAIERTIKRLTNAQVTERETVAKLKFQWEPDDGGSTPVFLYLKAPHGLRKIDNEWKLDANVFLDVERAEELFKSGSLWPVWREEMELMNQLTEALEKRKIQTVPQFEKQLQQSVEALKARHSAEAPKTER